MNKLYTYISLTAIKIFLFAVLYFICNFSFAQDTNRIDIIGANYLTNFEDKIDNVKLVGNARFAHDSVFMRCDVAYIYNETKSVKAIGNIIINQGDSLYLYGDSLKYFGETKIAYVYGNVKLVENDLTLKSDSLVYNLNTNIAYYKTGGVVTSKKNNNTLTSKRGYYYSNKKVLSFKDSVTLKNEDYTMKSDTLDYDESTEIAYFSGNTTIKGEDNFIFCKNGWYDTQNDIAQFSKDAYLISDEHKLEGDSLYYNRNNGYGKALGNVIISDSINKLQVKGELAEHYDKQNISLVTGNTFVSKEFDSDTLFLSSDTIRIYKDTNDKKNILYAHYNVRFYKSDIQGDCDSMIYNQADSLLRMFSDPVIWSEKSQLSGDTILVQIANNKIKEINLFNNSFVIDQEEELLAKDDTLYLKDSTTNLIDTVLTTKNVKNTLDQFNQIKGKNIKGLFTEDTLRKIIVNGNGQSIYYVGDEGKRKEGVNKIVCSNIIINFKNNKVDGILFLKKPEGTLFPVEDLSKKESKLDGFSWQIEKRPKNKEDLLSKTIIDSKQNQTNELNKTK